ncbi:MAG: hypothetical protein LUD81_11295 [Clostridiales bacterium]|nr:hypothetical protein [Clostridiales bacterium]
MTTLTRISAAAAAVIIALEAMAFFALAETASAFTEKFDISLGIYTETFAGGRQFTSSVPDGGMVYDAVVLNIPKDIDAYLTCDGRGTGFSSGTPIYEKGYYTLTASAEDVISGESVSGLFTFRIMGEPVDGVYNERYNCPMISCVNTPESDAETGMYKYKFPNYKAFYSSVAGYGADVSQAVFYLPVNVGYTFTRNGSEISLKNNEPVTAPGSYVLSVYAKNNGVTSDYARVYKTDFTFSITGNETAQSIYGTASAEVSGSVSSIYDETEEIVTETTTEAVISDTLTESFNSEAGLYKETFSNGDGFYTNIANNGMSGGNIYIDIPSNMTVSMTIDGIEGQYINKEYMNDQGTYILNVITESEGRKYRARFTFRIQKGLAASADSISEEPEEERAPAEAVFDEDFLYSSEDYGAVTNRFDENRELFAFDVGNSTVYANMPSGMFSSSSLRLNMSSRLSCSVRKDGEEYEMTGDTIEENGSYNLYISDSAGNSIELDFYLYGRAVNGFESFTAPGGYSITKIEYEDYKNTYGFGEKEEKTEAETAEGEESSEEEQNIDEEAERAEEEAEDGYNEVNAQMRLALRSGRESITLPIDGRYRKELRGDDLPALSTEIIIDRTAPVVEFEGLKSNMKSTGNEVTAVCTDEEASLYLFSRSGEEKLLSENGGSVKISGIGEHTLSAVDSAGNRSDYTFKITRHIGAAGIGAIVFLILIVVGVVVFIVYSSKKFSVR